MIIQVTEAQKAVAAAKKAADEKAARDKAAKEAAKSLWTRDELSLLAKAAAKHPPVRFMSRPRGIGQHVCPLAVARNRAL